MKEEKEKGTQTTFEQCGEEGGTEKEKETDTTSKQEKRYQATEEGFAGCQGPKPRRGCKGGQPPCQKAATLEPRYAQCFILLHCFIQTPGRRTATRNPDSQSVQDRHDYPYPGLVTHVVVLGQAFSALYERLFQGNKEQQEREWKNFKSKFGTAFRQLT